MVSDYKYCLEEIEELKQQIEKMKCCGNCKHNSKFWLDIDNAYGYRCKEKIKSKVDDFDEGCSYWELEESGV